MKTKIIDCLKKKVLIVADFIPPNDYKVIGYYKEGNSFGFKLTCGFSPYRHIEIAKGNWEYLHKLSEVTEEQCKELVNNNSMNCYDNYKGIPDNKYTLLSAKESFLSALEANGVQTQNPLSNEIHAPDIEEWQQANVNVFTPNQTLIFIEQ